MIAIKDIKQGNFFLHDGEILTRGYFDKKMHLYTAFSLDWEHKHFFAGGKMVEEIKRRDVVLNKV